MPNHFHLMIKQATKEIYDRYYESAYTNSYVVYFNKKYKRAVRFFTGKIQCYTLIEGSLIYCILPLLYSP